MTSSPFVNWEFFLANSTTMSYIGDITGCRDKSLTVGLNQPGNFSCRMNQDHSVASSVQPITTCVIAIKNGVAVWSGPVWTIEDNLPDKNTQINCVGWYELLNHRLLLADQTFTSTDAGIIAQQLIVTTNSVVATGITVGGVETTQVRTKPYKKFQNIGQEIQSMAEVESGYDWTIDPVTKVFNIYAVRRTDKTNIVFGYKWGPSNLASVSKSTDSSTLVNSMYALGRSATYGPSENIISQGAYGLFQESASLSDVNDITTLGAFANAEIAIRSTPRVIYKIIPIANSVSGTNYSIFVDYNIGDKVYFVCNTGRINTGASPQAVRVFGATVTVDDNGVERITDLQTSP